MTLSYVFDFTSEMQFSRAQPQIGMNISSSKGKSRRYTCGTLEEPGVTRLVRERHLVPIVWCAQEQILFI